MSGKHSVTYRYMKTTKEHLGTCICGWTVAAKTEKDATDHGDWHVSRFGRKR